MLILHTANRYEDLRDSLLEDFRAEGWQGDPFVRRHIIVPSLAIRQDLQRAVAEFSGVCTRLDFPFLSQWLWACLAEWRPVASVSPFAPQRLCWLIFRTLEAPGFGAEYPRLGAWLSGADPVMRWELAHQLSGQFDRLLTYRADWLEAWRTGRRAEELGAESREDEVWLAALWRGVCQAMGKDEQHPALAFLAACQKENGHGVRQAHPERGEAINPELSTVRPELLSTVRPELLSTVRPELLSTVRPELVEGQASGFDRLTPNGGGSFVEGQASGFDRLTPNGGGSFVGGQASGFDRLTPNGGGSFVEGPTVRLFALPGIPPLSIQLIRSIAQTRDVALYLLNPCAEFWFDVVSPRQLARLEAEGRADYHEVGHPLLASWGRQSQTLLSPWISDEAVFVGRALHTPYAETLLGTLQNSVLNLEPFAPAPLASGDGSLQIQVCHSMMRELEVLYERLDRLMTAPSDWRADEILVLLPDLETAAPLVDAVFGARGNLPYTLTGRTQENPVARCLLDLLAFAEGRLPAREGISLLREPLVAARFGLDRDDLNGLEVALQAAGLHWGLDAEDRLSAGLPADERHTWRDALSRLWLGWASASPNQPFAGVLPVPALSGRAAIALGGLWRFLESLEKLRLRLQGAARLGLSGEAWQGLYLWVLSRFLLPSGDAVAQAHAVREAIGVWVGDMAGAEALLLPSSVARRALAEQLAESALGGVATGRITFAALPSLRNLPYRFIAVLGLNHGEFPGISRPPEFDVLARHPRPGDRYPSQEERNLFLDVLLSAREVLHLSYTGRSQRDDSVLPPSVVLEELGDVLRQGLGEAAEGVWVRHALQPWGEGVGPEPVEGYLLGFDRLSPNGGVLSPNGGVLSLSNLPRTDFFSTPLPPPEPRWQEVSWVALQRFFRHPARAVLRDRLGIRLPFDADVLEDEVPLMLGRRSQWPMVQQLLAAALASPAISEDALADLARAGTALPSGAMGEAALRTWIPAIQSFAAALRPRLASLPCAIDPVRVSVTVPDGVLVSLSLTLSDVRPCGLVRYRLGPLRAGDVIAAWLDHLALHLLVPPGGAVALNTWHGAWDIQQGECVSVAFRPLASVEAAKHELAQWVSAYWQGLQAPLPFPPRTAWAWMTENEKVARTVWWDVSRSTGAAQGEGTDAWWQMALQGQRDPARALDDSVWREAVLEQAHRLFRGLLAHRIEPDAQGDGDD